MDDDDVEMDMTPMIDVSFQLLIFFLLTINFKLREGNLSSHLPKQGGVSPSSAEEQLEQLEVDISYDSPTSSTTLKIGGENYNSWSEEQPMIANKKERKKMGIKAWNAYEEIKEGLDKMPPIKISTGSTVPTGRVITTIDVLKEYVIQKAKQKYGSKKKVPLKFKGADRQDIINAIQ